MPRVRLLTTIAAPILLLAGVRTVLGEPDLAALIAAAPAGGEVRVPAGTYPGTVVIDRSVTLVANGRVVIDAGGEGDALRVEAPDVTIRGFTITNTGISLDRENSGITVCAPRVTIENNVLTDVLFGIYLKKAPGSVIRANRVGSKSLAIARRGDGIRLWESPGSVVEDNDVSGSRDVVMWFSDNVHLTRNHVHGGRYGLHFMYSDNNVLTENVLEDNSVGAFLMYSHNLTLTRNVFSNNRGPSGFGVGLKDIDGVTAEGNVFAGNRVGLHLDNSPSRVDITHTFTGNVFAYNDIGVAFMPSVTRNRFSGNSFVDNIEQVGVMGAGDFEGNDFSVDGRGNYWSDYAGFDLDGDGIGDLPYKSQSLFENLMDREPKLRLFLFSPAQEAIEMSARAFPIVRPRPKVSDDAPLLQPVQPAFIPPRGRTAWPLGAIGAGLLGLGVLTLFARLPGAARRIAAAAEAPASSNGSPIGAHR